MKHCRWSLRTTLDDRLGETPMTAKDTRNLILAVAAALVLICALPPPFAGLVAFIGGFTTLMLWWGGVWGTPQFVRAARQAARKEQRVAAPHPAVAARTFCYANHLWRMRFGVAIFWAMALFHALLAALLVVALPGTPEERLATALVPAAAAWMFGRIAYATPRMRIDVDPAGIASRQLFGTVRMAWDDIVIISRKDFYLNSVQYGTNYHVYSREDKITVGDKLPELSELMSIVESNARYVVATE